MMMKLMLRIKYKYLLVLNWYYRFRAAKRIFIMTETRYHCSNCDSITLITDIPCCWIGVNMEKGITLVATLKPIICSYCEKQTYGLFVHNPETPTSRAISEAYKDLKLDFKLDGDTDDRELGPDRKTNEKAQRKNQD